MRSKRLSLYPSSRFTLVVVLLVFVVVSFSLAAAQTENILHRFNPTYHSQWLRVRGHTVGQQNGQFDERARNVLHLWLDHW